MHTILGKKSLLLPIGVFALLLFSDAADATHRTWVRHDGGTVCQKYGFNGATGSLVNNEAAWNNGSYSEKIVCPVNLAGIFLGNSENVPGYIPIHTNMAALQADVYFYDGNDASSIECWMVALTSTGAESWSEFRYSCVTEGGCGWSSTDPGYVGSNRLAFADPTNVVNRRLGVENALTFNDVRSLTFACWLPPVGSWGWSGVTGVKTAICQRDSSISGQACFDIHPNP